MHDPNTLAHTIPLPIPKRRKKSNKPAGLRRKRYTSEEKNGEPIYPWYRPCGWVLTLFGSEWGLKVLAYIWHVDPEKNGSDDSCDWFNHKAKWSPEQKALADTIWDAESLFGNPPHFNSSDDTSREYDRWKPVAKAARALLNQPSRTRLWHIHPRWHVWHWRIQIPFVQRLKRWLFSRCISCGSRFPWGYAPVRSQAGARHHDCNRPAA